jgi:signal transduction histidine kinase
VSILVSNNGPPLTHEQQVRLFRPFFTTKSGGSGLGLSIVKKMVTQMNATIDVRTSGTAAETWTMFELRFTRTVAS